VIRIGLSYTLSGKVINEQMNTFYKLKASVSMERLDGETIAIDFVSGRFYSFRETGADLLWLITQGIGSDHFADVLGEYFQPQVDASEMSKHIKDFLEALITLNLIEIDTDNQGDKATAHESIHLPDDYHRTAWVSPMMTSNDDLADLLKIDPIHDVSESGWPEFPSD
jgi:hypothetical protein